MTGSGHDGPTGPPGFCAALIISCCWGSYYVGPTGGGTVVVGEVGLLSGEEEEGVLKIGIDLSKKKR